MKKNRQYEGRLSEAEDVRRGRMLEGEDVQFSVFLFPV